MVSGITYKQAKLADDWDAIVIDSGIGGAYRRRVAGRARR